MKYIYSKYLKLGRSTHIYLIFILFLFSLPTIALSNCMPVKGKFSSYILPPDQCLSSPVAFCTSGELTGRLHGKYDFIAQNFVPANEPSVPGASYYSGFSFVHTRHGDIQLTDTGTLDLVNGRISSLLTVSSGTGQYAQATGFLFITGFSDMVQGINSGSYSGEICAMSYD